MIKHLTLPKKMAAMVLLAGAALSIAPVQAASYPTKQIELVVPYAAGGGTDLVARAFADAAKNHLPVSIGVINKPGGGGAIGLSEIAAARPNGYKIGLGTVELTTLPSLGMVRFKTSDFKPIARLNADPAAIWSVPMRRGIAMKNLWLTPKRIPEKYALVTQAPELSGIWRQLHWKTKRAQSFLMSRMTAQPLPLQAC